MDKFIYATSEAVCQGLDKVGLNQLAYDLGFKGADILGQPAVFCGAQGGGSYWVGVILWVLVLYGLLAAVRGQGKKLSPDE